MPEKHIAKESSVGKSNDRFIDDFLSFLEVERNASYRTLRNYEHSLNKYKESYKAFEEWFSCTSDDFREYLYECMKLEMARSTIRLHFSALRSFFKFLTRMPGLILNT